MQITTATIETARTRCAERPDWLRAIDRAALLLPASAVETLPAGRLRITSGRSGQNYVTTAQSCSCPAGLAGRACWHRAAARLVELEPRRLSCRYCGGLMLDGHTPGGERAYTCSGCGHTAHAATVEPGAEVA